MLYALSSKHQPNLLFSHHLLFCAPLNLNRSVTARTHSLLLSFNAKPPNPTADFTFWARGMNRWNSIVTSRRRVDKKKREKGPNRYGRQGNLRCAACRKIHSKVQGIFSWANSVCIFSCVASMRILPRAKFGGAVYKVTWPRHCERI